MAAALRSCQVWASCADCGRLVRGWRLEDHHDQAQQGAGRKTPAGRAVEEVKHRSQLAAEVAAAAEGHSSMGVVVVVVEEDCSWPAAAEGAEGVDCCWLAAAEVGVEVCSAVLEVEDWQDAQVVLEAVVQVKYLQGEQPVAVAVAQVQHLQAGQVVLEVAVQVQDWSE